MMTDQDLIRGLQDELGSKASEIEALQKKYDDAYAGWKSYAERYTEADAANNENCKTIASLTKERDSLHSTVAELEAEANKEHAKAVELCDKLIEARRRIEELEKYEKRLDWVEANCVRLIYKGFQDDYLDFSTVTVCKAIDNAMQNK